MKIDRDESNKPTARSPWGCRIFIGLVALMLTSAVYVLSTGPMVVVMLRTGLYRNSFVEKGFQVFYWPLIILSASESVAGDWVEAYVDWWAAITHTHI
jgi:hypothetical protein